MDAETHRPRRCRYLNTDVHARKLSKVQDSRAKMADADPDPDPGRRAVLQFGNMDAVMAPVRTWLAFYIDNQTQTDGRLGHV